MNHYGFTVTVAVVVMAILLLGEQGAQGTAVAPATLQNVSYEQWRKHHGITTPSTESERFWFHRAVSEIERLKQDSPHATFTLGKDAGTSWGTPKSLLKVGGSLSTKYFTNAQIAEALSASRDWHTDFTITRVKNQGSCGSCWAFGVLASVESMYANAGKPLTALSEQYVLDCLAPSLGIDPCIGGDIRALANGLAANQATWKLPQERYYEYSSYDNSTHACNTTVPGMVSVSSAMQIGASTGQSLEDAMAAWVYQYGPITVGVGAWEPAWQLYSSGIADCPSTSVLDHGVAIVGYGTEVVNGVAVPYWKIKNSWTPMWGESGYIRLKRGQNACGLTNINTVVQVNIN